MIPFGGTERGEIWTGRKGRVVAVVCVLQPKRALVDLGGGGVDLCFKSFF